MSGEIAPKKIGRGHERNLDAGRPIPADGSQFRTALAGREEVT
jgi:hypothetical protein